jgi:hypothetical protein
MASKQQYVIVTGLANSPETQAHINELTGDGYEVVSQSYAGNGDRWCCWTMRLRSAITDIRLAELEERLDKRIVDLEDWAVDVSEKLAEICDIIKVNQ